MQLVELGAPYNEYNSGNHKVEPMKSRWNLLTAITLLGMLINGSTTRRSGVTRWHVAVPISLIGIGLILSILAGDFVAVAIAFYCLAGAGYTYHPSFWSLPS